ncbi:hypothetical protein [Cloacibacillus porcorum]|uniref:hypothetical protein n=1 Tax=Cloacibacillus porcorum TaxID=1197717 RepID=UPI003F0BB134
MNSEKKEQIAFRLDESLARQFKAAIALRGEKMTPVLIRYIEQYIEESKELESK